MAKPLPTIGKPNEIITKLKVWEQRINKAIQRPRTPRIPWDFAVTSKRGGNELSWARVKEADGYEIARTDDGNFDSGVTIIPIRDPDQTAYFDSLVPEQAGSPPTRYYKIRATAGTALQPHVVKGIWSGIVSVQAIDPTDTTTPETRVLDQVTRDELQRKARYKQYY